MNEASGAGGLMVASVRTWLGSFAGPSHASAEVKESVHSCPKHRQCSTTQSNMNAQHDGRCPANRPVDVSNTWTVRTSRSVTSQSAAARAEAVTTLEKLLPVMLQLCVDLPGSNPNLQRESVWLDETTIENDQRKSTASSPVAKQEIKRC